jgi:hypothetical protein
MIDGSDIADIEINLEGRPSYACYDILLWESDAEIGVPDEKSYHTIPDLSSFHLISNADLRIVFCDLHLLDRDTSFRSEACDTLIRPGDRHFTLQRCLHDVSFFEHIGFILREDDREIGSQYFRFPIDYEKRWLYRIIASDDDIVAVC